MATTQSPHHLRATSVRKLRGLRMISMRTLRRPHDDSPKWHDFRIISAQPPVGFERARMRNQTMLLYKCVYLRRSNVAVRITDSGVERNTISKFVFLLF